MIDKSSEKQTNKYLTTSFMVVVVSEQAFNLSTGEAEAADLSEFHSRVAWSTDEFQDLQGNTETLSEKQSISQTKNQPNKQKPWEETSDRPWKVRWYFSWDVSDEESPSLKDWEDTTF